MRDRSIDLHIFNRLVAALLLGHTVHSAHVVQAVGELDDDDAHVLAHRQQHFSDVFRLLLLLRGQRHFAELRHAVHERHDFLAELARDILECDGRVLDRVVQQRRDDGTRVHADADEDIRHADRVDDVRLSGQTELTLVGLAGERVGAVDLLDFLGGEMIFQSGSQRGVTVAAVGRYRHGVPP